MDEAVSVCIDAVKVTVAADSSMVATLRQQVGSFARDSGAAHDVVDELKLVVSELATNVVQHSASNDITMTFARMVGGWMIDVDNADGIAALDSYRPPAPDALSGRGLFIAQSVMDEVSLVDDLDGTRHLQCIKLAPPE